MYREAIAPSVQRGRPGLVDVRIAPPEEQERELASFRPHLLVHNEAGPGGGPLPKAAIEAVPHRLEVLYSDRMDARLTELCATPPQTTCSGRWTPPRSPSGRAPARRAPELNPSSSSTSPSISVGQVARLPVAIMQPSAWKRSSPKFASRILHRSTPALPVGLTFRLREATRRTRDVVVSDKDARACMTSSGFCPRENPIMGRFLPS